MVDGPDATTTHLCLLAGYEHHFGADGVFREHGFGTAEFDFDGFCFYSLLGLESAR